MNTFYTVVTIWTDDHTDTIDFPNLELARKEWDLRMSLLPHSHGAMESVRILRVSDKRILDITPGREDFN